MKKSKKSDEKITKLTVPTSQASASDAVSESAWMAPEPAAEGTGLLLSIEP